MSRSTLKNDESPASESATSWGPTPRALVRPSTNEATIPIDKERLFSRKYILNIHVECVLSPVAYHHLFPDDLRGQPNTLVLYLCETNSSGTAHYRMLCD